MISQPFNSYEWSRQIFSLQRQYNLRQTGDERKENINNKITFEFIQYQIFLTNIVRIV